MQLLSDDVIGVRGDDWAGGGKGEGGKGRSYGSFLLTKAGHSPRRNRGGKKKERGKKKEKKDIILLFLFGTGFWGRRW